MKLSLVQKQNIESLMSDKVKEIPPSGIRDFFDIVYSTPDCISLGVGEPDFVTPWRVSDAGIYAIKDGFTHYTPNKGLIKLRELISIQINKDLGVEYDPEAEIIITMGVSQGLDLALRTIINPGDEIIIIEPCYVSYAANVKLINGIPVLVQTQSSNKFKIDIEDIKKSITPKTKGIILNYPSNPTGSTINRETLKYIAQIAIENNLIVISDEIYSALVYEHNHFSITSIPGMKERTIYLNGFSKSLAMTGWRLGYVACQKGICDLMLKIHQYTALCAPSIAQHAAIEAMKNAAGDINQMKSEYARRRNFIFNRFTEIGYPCHRPEGAFYVFPDISQSGMKSREFALNLLKSEKVAVVPGIVFGSSGENHIRCSFATSIENITEAMNRIENFSKKIR
jgi:aminotransferase